jgi:hypothetical protein
MDGVTLNRSGFGRMRVTYPKANCGVSWKILKAGLAESGKIIKFRLAPASTVQTVARGGSCHLRASTKVKYYSWGVHQSFQKKKIVKLAPYVISLVYRCVKMSIESLIIQRMTPNVTEISQLNLICNSWTVFVTEWPCWWYYGPVCDRIILFVMAWLCM